MKRLAKANLVIMAALAITLLFGVTGPALALVPIPGAVVHDDGTVTFTMEAANTTTMTVLYSAAEDVTVPMVQTSPGVWSVTVGPLAPNWYRYCFFVDGLRMHDPVNPAHYFSEYARLWSFFMVPGEEAEFLATKDVPHGTVSTVWYHSSVSNSWRTMWVYTPPGYNKDNRKYPVLYLNHGTGNTGQEWFTPNRANFILDNLIAEGKAVPMIAVSPTHSDFPDNPDPALDVYPVQELIGNIIPTIEKQFRVLPGSKNRAMAGLSRGGRATLKALIQAPTTFDYFCPLSAAWSSEIAILEQYHKDLLLALGANRNITLLWISIGDKDTRVMSNLPGMLALFDKYGIEYTFTPYAGAHMPDVWRHQLSDFAQLLFR